MHVKSVEAEMSSRWCGVEEEGLPAQMSSSLLDHGLKGRGTALLQLVDVQKEIQAQQLNILKAFYVDLLVPLETNIDKDTKVVACEQKRFMQQHKCLQESYLKAVAVVKKQRKKQKGRNANLDKEIKNLQQLEEEKMKLDCFCERSLKQAITQERRRFGFVLERQCSLTKHNLVYHSQHLENVYFFPNYPVYSRNKYIGGPGLKYPKVMAYYYRTTHQNVINYSSMDWKTLRFLRSRPIGCSYTRYSAIADGKSFTLTSLVKMWTPQQKMQRVL
ncbi:uncharacterized protein TNCV_2675821 [Trichonephila clavipes]|nr:uncharacterized protein TNCV_2675821 [Trichonephila clavipes]